MIDSFLYFILSIWPYLLIVGGAGTLLFAISRAFWKFGSWWWICVPVAVFLAGLAGIGLFILIMRGMH